MRRRAPRIPLGLLVTSGLIATVPAGCAPAPARSTLVAPKRAPIAAAPAAPALPPGILAEVQGVRGVIRVEERDGLRRLTIDGAVQAAVPVDAIGDPARGDPLVALLRAARPGARRALVIGLGSGRTAAELAAAGIEVEVAEIEPAVIDLARRFFGYTGHAAAEDGLAALRRAAPPFDLIVLDAYAGSGPPPELLAVDTLERAAVAGGGAAVIAARLLGAPSAPRITALRRAARRVAWFTDLHGSGVGDEEQNLYLLASKKPLNLVQAEATGAWPIPEQPEPTDAARVGPPPPGAAPAAARRVSIVGYLIRAREDGALCLDLPHYEMGARRFRLAGPAAAALEALVPAGRDAPTTGDIGSDGDTAGTLREFLGGGGVKRSDVRFSPVAVAVEGEARLLAVVHPDAADRVPADLRGDAPTHPGLPYGGALYELQVSRVIWRFDRAAWRALEQRLAKPAARAVRALDQDDLGAASDALRDYLAALDAGLGEVAVRVGVRREVAGLVAPIDAERAALPPGASTRDRAAACDRAKVGGGLHSDTLSRDALAIDAALARCAERNYGQVAAGQGEHAEAAAARLLALLEDRSDILQPALMKALEARMDALRRRFPGVEPLQTAPGR